MPKKYETEEERIAGRKAANKRWYLQNREKRNALAKAWNRKRRRDTVALLGGGCYFCGNSLNRALRMHKKDGKPHPTRTALDLVPKNPEQFVLLCEGCHKSVHFCMRYLGMRWWMIKVAKFLHSGISSVWKTQTVK